MNIKIACLVMLTCALVSAFPTAEEGMQNLDVLAYDSFVSEWGLGPQVEQLFEERHGVDLVYINGGDAVVTAQLAQQYTKDDPDRPDVVVGIDNNMVPLVESLGILRQKPIAHVADIAAIEGVLPPYLVPFDYGYFAIIYDSERISQPPQSLLELTESRFNKSLVLMHPGTSSPGLSFFYWTIAAFGESDFLAYWQNLNKSILTITDGWTTGYGMFTAGEAPLVLSYTTSPAYHIEFEQSDRYKAAVFADGHYVQVEGAGVTAYAKNPQLAETFVLFLQDVAIQEAVPLKNFMYPIRTDVETPDSFQALETEFPTLHLSYEKIKTHGDVWLDSWNQLMSQ